MSSYEIECVLGEEIIDTRCTDEQHIQFPDLVPGTMYEFNVYSISNKKRSLPLKISGQTGESVFIAEYTVAYKTIIHIVH